MPEETPIAYFGPALGGELLLEVGDLGAEREGGVAADPLDHFHQLGEELGVGGVEADEGDAAGAGRGGREGGQGLGVQLIAPGCSVSRKRAAASLRERTPNFENAEERWLLIVLSAR